MNSFADVVRPLMLAVAIIAVLLFSGEGGGGGRIHIISHRTPLIIVSNFFLFTVSC